MKRNIFGCGCLAFAFAVLSGLTVRADTVVVTPSSTNGWSAYTPGTSTVAITSTNLRSGDASLELTSGTNAASAFLYQPGSPLGTWGNLSALSFDWFISDFTGSVALPPDLALLVYAPTSTSSFFLHWDTCSLVVPCVSQAQGSWQTTDLLHSLSIQQFGTNPVPTSLSEISPDAPIYELHVRSDYNFGEPWHGYVDNVTIGFGGQSTTFNFEASTTSVPEPSSLFLLGTGISVGLCGFRRRR